MIDIIVKLMLQLIAEIVLRTYVATQRTTLRRVFKIRVAKKFVYHWYKKINFREFQPEIYI